MHARRLPFFLLIALAAAGCDRAQADMDDRRLTLEERTAIAAYAAAVPQTLELQQVWVDALKDTGKLGDPEAITRSINERVLPELQTYITTLEAMPVATDQLESIHGAMIQTHSALHRLFKRFADGLSTTNYESRREELTRGLELFHAAQLDYRDSLQTHYSGRGFDLKPAPPLR
ncbi:MAG: hypothetical protein ACI9WU_001871 [Myxococcota bacterium]